MDSQLEPPRKKPKLSLESFQQQLRILVGPTKTEVFVQKSMICAASDFFNSACKPEWMHDGANTITLAEEDPVIFAIFLSWIYAGKISESDEFMNPESGDSVKAKEERKKQWTQLVKCYVMGEMLMAIDFKNTIMDMLLMAAKNLWVMDVEVAGVDAESIEMIFEGTPEKSPLRSLVIDNCLKHLGHEHPIWSSLKTLKFSFQEFLRVFARRGVVLAGQHGNFQHLLDEVWDKVWCGCCYEYHIGSACLKTHPSKTDSEAAKKVI